MVPLKTSVRYAHDFPLQRIQEIYGVHYRMYEDNPCLLVEFNNNISETCTFIDDWKSEDIVLSTYQFHGEIIPTNYITNQFNKYI